ncbi:MAG TPA: glycosyltransferase family 4 protein [Candidatus Angelobacter sp.]|nr:glycosyltransferase family 4 protein [Candidatus Angelobacter sp.]
MATQSPLASTRPKALFLASEDRFFWGHPLPVARAALRDGYEVIVATGVHSYAEQIRNEGFRLIPLQFSRRSHSPGREFRAIRELRHIYRSEEPDIVHHLSLKSVLYGSIAAKGNGDPQMVNAVTGLGYLVASSSWKARLLRPLIWKVLQFFLRRPNQRILVENQEDKQLLVTKVKVPPEKVIVTRGAGVDIDAFYPSALLEGLPVVLLASRMLWIKGIMEFVEAARLLRAKGIMARFVLAGDTDPSNPTCVPRQKLLEWQDSGEVEWWGHQEVMVDVYRQASLVCLPSWGGEGIPKVLMEAAASGLALITTDVPGCRDIVQDGINGIVVPPRDRAALAGAIEELLKDPVLRLSMGRRSREIATREFSQTAVVRQILELYKELLRFRPAQTDNRSMALR